MILIGVGQTYSSVIYIHLKNAQLSFISNDCSIFGGNLQYMFVVSILLFYLSDEC